MDPPKAAIFGRRHHTHDLGHNEKKSLTVETAIQVVPPRPLSTPWCDLISLLIFLDCCPPKCMTISLPLTIAILRRTQESEPRFRYWTSGSFEPDPLYPHLASSEHIAKKAWGITPLLLVGQSTQPSPCSTQEHSPALILDNNTLRDISWPGSQKQVLPSWKSMSDPPETSLISGLSST